MRNVSLSIVMLMLLATGALPSRECDAQLRDALSEPGKFKNDYITGKPFQYQPCDPWTRSKVFGIHTGHAGKFYNCDDEESKRNSPYICWKVHFERDIPVHKSCRQRFSETMDEVYQRVCDGAGDCIQAECGPCDNGFVARGGGGLRSSISSLTGANRSPCGNANCSGSCGNNSCRQKAELTRRLVSTARNAGGRALSTGKAVAGKTMNLQLFGHASSACTSGNCAPTRVQNGCQSNCGCSDCNTVTESASGLISHSYIAPRTASRAASTSMSFVRQNGASPTSPQNSLPRYAGNTTTTAASATAFAKEPCNCAKCQRESQINRR